MASDSCAGSSPVCGTNINYLKFNKIMINIYIVEQNIADGIWCRINTNAYKNEKEAIELANKCHKTTNHIYRVKKLIIS